MSVCVCVCVCVCVHLCTSSLPLSLTLQHSHTPQHTHTQYTHTPFSKSLLIKVVSGLGFEPMGDPFEEFGVNVIRCFLASA